MSLENKAQAPRLWSVAGPSTPGVFEAIPGLIDTACAALERKGLPYSRESVEHKAYAVYTKQDQETVALVAGPCVVLVAFGEQWWMPGLALIEEAIYRFRDGDIRDTFAGLEDYARMSGCARIIVGTAAVMGRREVAYGRILKRQGYVATAQQHTKELA